MEEIVQIVGPNLIANSTPDQVPNNHVSSSICHLGAQVPSQFWWFEHSKARAVKDCRFTDKERATWQSCLYLTLCSAMGYISRKARGVISSPYSVPAAFPSPAVFAAFLAATRLKAGFVPH